MDSPKWLWKFQWSLCKVLKSQVTDVHTGFGTLYYRISPPCVFWSNLSILLLDSAASFLEGCVPQKYFLKMVFTVYMYVSFPRVHYYWGWTLLFITICQWGWTVSTVPYGMGMVVL